MPDIYLNFKHFAPDDDSGSTNLPTGVARRLPIYCASYLHTTIPSKLFTLAGLDDDPATTKSDASVRNIDTISAQLHFTDYAALRQFLTQLATLVPASVWQYAMPTQTDVNNLAPLLWCNFLWPNITANGNSLPYSNGDCRLDYGPGKYTEASSFLEFNRDLLRLEVGPKSANGVVVPFALARARTVDDLGIL